MQWVQWAYGNSQICKSQWPFSSPFPLQNVFAMGIKPQSARCRSFFSLCRHKTFVWLWQHASPKHWIELRMEAADKITKSFQNVIIDSECVCVCGENRVLRICITHWSTRPILNWFWRCLLEHFRQLKAGMSKEWIIMNHYNNVLLLPRPLLYLVVNLEWI